MSEKLTRQAVPPTEQTWAPLHEGVQYANVAYDGSPISDDRLNEISRWGGATPDEVRFMAADLWQRRKGDQFQKNWTAALEKTP